MAQKKAGDKAQNASQAGTLAGKSVDELKEIELELAAKLEDEGKIRTVDGKVELVETKSEEKGEAKSEEKGEAKAEVGSAAATEQSFYDRIVKKKGWDKDTAKEILAKGYEELEKNFHKTRQEISDIQKELAIEKVRREENAKLGAGQGAGFTKDDYERMNELWREQLEKDPHGTIMDIRKFAVEEAEKNIYQKYVMPMEKQAKEVGTRKEMEVIINTLPGKSKEEKMEYYETIKDDLDRLEQEYPFLKEQAGGKLALFKIWKGDQASWEGSGDEDVSGKKGAINAGGSSSGGGDQKSLMERWKEMSPADKEGLTDEQLDKLEAELEKENKAKGLYA